jgi:hypothetical protein
MISPEATFDTLAVVSRLRPRLEFVFASEIHLFLYLSCILSISTKQPVSTWGYSFAGTSQGAPYSPEVQFAISELVHAGDLTYRAHPEGGIIATEQGMGEYELLGTLAFNQTRDLCIAGACESMLALPVPLVRTALEHEPVLKRALSRPSSRQLLVAMDAEAIYNQFAALADVLGPINPRELLVPAVVWLSYLVRLPDADIEPEQMELPL